MMNSDVLLSICRTVNEATYRKNISAHLYVMPRLDRDVLLTNCVFLASRQGRILQISIEEEMSSADAFFKSTGLHDDERLLQLTYPVHRVAYDQAVTIFEHWIVELQKEEVIKATFKNLFDPIVRPRRAAQ